MSSTSALNSLLSSSSSSSASPLNLSSLLTAATGASSTGIDVSSAVEAAVYAAQAPERQWQAEQAEQVLRRTYRNLGWLMAEFAHMPRYSAEFVQQKLIRYQGLEHYDAAMARGRGVLVLTGHLGAWELSSFAHSLLGRPILLLTLSSSVSLLHHFPLQLICDSASVVDRRSATWDRSSGSSLPSLHDLAWRPSVLKFEKNQSQAS